MNMNLLELETNESDTRYESLDFIYNEIKWATEIQRNSLEAVQTKAGTMMGFSGAILALLFGSVRDTNLGAEVRLLLIMSVVLSLIAIFTFIGVTWSKRLRIDPDPGVLLEDYYTEKMQATQLQVAVNRVDAYRSNMRMIERSAFFLRIGIFLEVAAMTFLAFAIVLFAGLS